MLSWNTKCFVQGGLVVGLYAYARQGPELTWITGALLIWIVYAINAILDVNFGCEHGTLYDTFKFM
jgi:hypothetical protein